VLYKTSAYYAPQLEHGIAWDDPDLGIAWPVASDTAKLSARDRAWPRLRDVTPSFRWAR
jgi:dTDP-4-dehydrorhamnose 3,5-epimerase